MKKLLPLICCVLLFATAKAQYVNIPDSSFRVFLKVLYPNCFNSAGEMDTSCNDILNQLSLNCPGRNIKNLVGISYFKNLQNLYCNNNLLANLPNLPNSLKTLHCYNNQLTSLSNLPNSLLTLYCYNNQLTSLLNLSNSLQTLYCYNNQLTSLPNLPNSLQDLYCGINLLTSLPYLPNSLQNLSCYNNKLTNLPYLPNSLQNLNCRDNSIFCLPRLSNGLVILDFDGKKINCLPNYLSSCTYYTYDTTRTWNMTNICNATNNKNHCQAFPLIQSFVYIDINANGKLDTIEKGKMGVKVSLASNDNSFANFYEVTYSTVYGLGTCTITAQAPPLYKAVPPSYTHSFSSYDTIAYDTFALKAILLKDSLAIKLTPINWAARAGRAYPYLVSYVNVGTTVLSNAAVRLNYDNNLLIYDSSSVNSVTNSGSNLSLNIGNLLPGQSGSFIAYFTVKTTAALSSSIMSIASIATNTAAANDTVSTTVRGSYDPNDKQATPTLTLQDVSDGKNIDYTIRFQNTGTDTAFNVVIADTLDSKLLANQVQMVGSSHPCRTTVKDNIIFFEFLDIMLPDSNVNKFGSNGFVSFKIKPVATVTNGTIIPNKAAIYFDYNSPVITKPANTIIQNPLPLQLLNFSAIPQKETDKILVYWNTANEVNTAYFIIETSSNGINFKSVAEVAAKGIGSNSYFYSIDKATVVYVRLKMVDKNGIFTYSNTIKLSSTVKESDGLMVLQNPIKHQLKLNVISTKLNKTNASLMNAQGKIVKRFILLQGHQTIDISAIAAGVYYLQSNEGSKKVVVE